MKKIIVILFIGSNVLISAYAQTRIGIKAGVNLTGISGSDADSDFPESSKKIGANAGIFLIKPIIPLLKFQGEFNFQMKGVNTKHGNYQYNYFDLLAAARLPIQKAFHVFAGPQLSFLSSNAHTGPKYDSSFRRSSITKTAFGIVAGLGWTSSYDVGFDLRVENGIGTIDATAPVHSFHNALLTWNIYYIFPGKRK